MSDSGKNFWILCSIGAMAIFVLTTTKVAEFISTSTCHVVTTIVLDYYELAFGTSFRFSMPPPHFETWVNFDHCILNILLYLLSSHLVHPVLVAHAQMPCGTITSKAMSDFALRAFERLLFLSLHYNKVVAIRSWTLKVITRITGRHNHLPLKSLPFSKFLLVQKPFNVIYHRKGSITARIRASDREFAHLYLS